MRELENLANLHERLDADLDPNHLKDASGRGNLLAQSLVLTSPSLETTDEEAETIAQTMKQQLIDLRRLEPETIVQKAPFPFQLTLAGADSTFKVDDVPNLHHARAFFVSFLDPNGEEFQLWLDARRASESLAETYALTHLCEFLHDEPIPVYEMLVSGDPWDAIDTVACRLTDCYVEHEVGTLLRMAYDSGEGLEALEDFADLLERNRYDKDNAPSIPNHRNIRDLIDALDEWSN